MKSTVAVAINSQLSFRQYICRACGLIYDEAVGDADSGLEAGTRFEDIPDAWMCPICGVGKSDFEPHVSVAVGTRPAMATRPNDSNARRSAPSGDNRRAYGGNSGASIQIIGAGIAGWSAAAAIRAHDATCRITLITACNGDVYAKPLLSVAFARGKTVENLITETGRDAAHRLNVRLIAEAWVSGIDSARQRVRSTRGSLSYHRLILAPGATPSRLAVDQGDADGQPEGRPLLWRINHWQHYAAFRHALDGAGAANERARVIVIGAGLVGCEMADDLAGAGHRVTLLEQANRLLPGLGSDRDAARLHAAFTESGIRFLGGVQIEKIEKIDTQVSVRRVSGELIEADIAISAAGLRIDKRLVTSGHLTFDNGIAVDATTMRTSQAYIYALGDCVSFAGKTMRFIEPIRQQAQTLAAAIVGAVPQPFDYRSPIVRVKTRSLPMSLTMASLT